MIGHQPPGLDRVGTDCFDPVDFVLSRDCNGDNVITSVPAPPLVRAPGQVAPLIRSDPEAAALRQHRVSGVAATPGADALLLGFDQSGSERLGGRPIALRPASVTSHQSAL